MGAEAGKRTGERVWTEDSIVGRRRVSFLRKKEITIHCFYLATFGVGAWPSCALQLPCSRKHAHTHAPPPVVFAGGFLEEGRRRPTLRQTQGEKGSR